MTMVFKYNMFILILISFVFIGCKDQPIKNNDSKVNICNDKILKADAELGEKRNHECETISLSQTIKNYTKDLESLDYSSCPTMFNSAFKSHIKAWNEMIPLTDNYSNLRGEMHDLFDKIEKGKDSSQFKPLLANIWSTWEDIEKASE